MRLRLFAMLCVEACITFNVGNAKTCVHSAIQNESY